MNLGRSVAKLVPYGKDLLEFFYTDITLLILKSICCVIFTLDVCLLQLFGKKPKGGSSSRLCHGKHFNDLLFFVW